MVCPLKLSTLQKVLYNLLRCLHPLETEYTPWKVHEDIYGNQIGGKLLAHKILMQGFYWPIIMQDAMDFTQKYDRYQKFANIQKMPSMSITQIPASWPFDM